jgi:peptidyl-prolyl cis-trans isomerase D
MLQSLRKHSKGWVAGLLFFVLILSFAAWGIDDMLRQGFQATGPVIEVGRETVSRAEFENAYRRMINQWQERLGQSIDYDTAKKAGLVERLIAQLESERLFALEARSKGLLVSSTLIAAQIREAEEYRGADGRFDPSIYRRALENAGISEAGYVALRKSSMTRDFLVDGLTQFESTPNIFGARLLQHRSELRSAEVLTVPLSAMKVPEPTDAALEAYHKANAAKYTAPEFRSITFLLIKPEDAAARVPLTEKDISDSYQTRKAEFTTPETRAIRQIIFKDEAAAKAGYAALIGGRTFETVAKEIAKAEPQDLGRVAADGMPVKELRDAAFKLKAGEVSEPVRSVFGWHILRVDEIVDQTVKPFEEVKDQVIKDLRQRRATAMLAQMRDQLDEALGAGTKLEEAAKKLALTPVTVEAIDAAGKDEKGVAVAGVPEDADFLRRVFRQPKGEEGELIDMRNQGFYTLRVNAVMPSALRPLAAIKDRVISDWKTEEAGKLAKAEGERIAGEAKAGKSLDEIGKAGSYIVRRSKPVTRGEAQEAPAGSLEQRLFGSKPGDVVVATTRDGIAVARIEEAKDERSEEDRTKARDEFLERFKEAYDEGIVAAYTAYLRANYRTKVDRAGIDQLLSPSTRR